MISLPFFSFSTTLHKTILTNQLTTIRSIWHPLRNVLTQTTKFKNNEWMGCRNSHDHSRLCVVSFCGYGKMLHKKIERQQKGQNQMVNSN